MDLLRYSQIIIKIDTNLTKPEDREGLRSSVYEHLALLAGKRLENNDLATVAITGFCTTPGTQVHWFAFLLFEGMAFAMEHATVKAAAEFINSVPGFNGSVTEDQISYIHERN